LLTHKKFHLLVRVFNHSKCFDKRDNTFKVSNRKIAQYLGVSPSSIDRLMRALHHLNLIKVVNNIIQEDIMLKPEFLHKKPRINFWFNKGLYHLEDFNRALDWVDVCWSIGKIISPETGEVLSRDIVRCLSTRRRYGPSEEEVLFINKCFTDAVYADNINFNEKLKEST
jgi:hypothetical protein